VGSQGTLDAYGIRWKIARALGGERVQLQRVGQRVLVYYCRTLSGSGSDGFHRPGNSAAHWRRATAGIPFPSVKSVLHRLAS
jgi:hypothetical protein